MRAIAGLPNPSQAEETTITVIVPLAIYRKMVYHALLAAPPNQSRSNWKETGGFLLGKWLPKGDVLLTDLVSVSSGSSVFVSITDPQAVQAIPWDRVTSGEPIVGWWHTHPGLRIFMSTTDQNTQIAYQRQNSNTVALVMDPAEITAKNPGMRGFQVKDGAIPKSLEVTLNFENVTDFQEVKQAVLYELAVPAIPIMEPASVENEALVLEIPQSVRVGEEFTFAVFLKSIEEPKAGLTHVQYSLELDKLDLCSRLLTSFHKHQVAEEGLLALIRIVAPSPGIAKVSLAEISLQNQQGEEISLRPLQHVLTAY
ncbi:MAG: Mov34/MPN/PAD-1 family protein [Candidatus Hodarchaeales archaeon]